MPITCKLLHECAHKVRNNYKMFSLCLFWMKVFDIYFFNQRFWRPRASFLYSNLRKYVDIVKWHIVLGLCRGRSLTEKAGDCCAYMVSSALADDDVWVCSGVGWVLMCISSLWKLVVWFDSRRVAYSLDCTCSLLCEAMIATCSLIFYFLYSACAMNSNIANKCVISCTCNIMFCIHK